MWKMRNQGKNCYFGGKIQIFFVFSISGKYRIIRFWSIYLHIQDFPPGFSLQFSPEFSPTFYVIFHGKNWYKISSLQFWLPHFPMIIIVWKSGIANWRANIVAKSREEVCFLHHHLLQFPSLGLFSNASFSS